MAFAIRGVLFFGLCMVFACSHARESFKGNPGVSYTPTQNLKNYALSSCLADGLTSKEAKKDAEDAAVGFRETGNWGMEAYQEVAAAGREYLEVPFLSRNGETLITMRCIHFFHEKKLDLIVNKYLKREKTHPHD